MCRLWKRWVTEEEQGVLFKDTPKSQPEDRGAHTLSSSCMARLEAVVVPGRLLPLPPSLSPSLQGTCVSKVPSLDCSSCHPLHEQFVLEHSSFPKETIPANSISGQGREVTGNKDKNIWSAYFQSSSHQKRLFELPAHDKLRNTQRVWISVNEWVILIIKKERLHALYNAWGKFLSLLT